jgi:hypothetical protein
MIAVALLWLIFALMFFYLAIRHWKLSDFSIEPSKLFGSGMLAEIRSLSESETPTGLIRFIEKFNPIYRELNKALVAGYLVAAFTALLSFVLALLQK